jgi:hypothetical protein
MANRKYNYELLKNIFDSENVTLLIDYSNKYLTRDTRIIGKCILCEKSFDKSFNELNKSLNFGCKSCAKIIKFKRIKNTMMDKYGVEYAAQSPIFLDKMKKSTFEKYGVENANQSEEIKSKIVETNLERYGVKYGLQSEEVKEKGKNTYLKNYGVKNPMQNLEIQKKTKETNLRKYKVEYCCQNPDIAEKQAKNSYKLKEYTMPSGKIIKYQGYENIALDELIMNEKINETDIIMGAKQVPTIWYYDDSGKKHRHFVDIFIPCQNRCIEIKSTWTAKVHKNVIFLKQNAAKELGYKYEIWVYDDKRNKVEYYN